MSARKHRVALSYEAQLDYDDILLYGSLQWTEEQVERFKQRIDRLIDELADYPEIGLERGDIFPGCRSRLMEPYIAYYQVVGYDIIVVRILHAHADVPRHL